MTETGGGGSRSAAAALELGAREELLVHELLGARRRAQRSRFRPGVARGGGAADVARQERSRRKLARALRALREVYGVGEAQAREALAYTNGLEDALQFLALQHTSERLPRAIRAAPAAAARDGRDGEEGGALEAQINTAPIGEGEDSGEDPDRDDGQEIGVLADSWDDEDNSGDVTEDAKTPVPADATATAEEKEGALSWTQQYVQLLAQREQQETTEVALSKEEKQIQELQAQYADLLEAVQHAKQRKNNSKKRQKMLAQEIQSVRQRLGTLGWDEGRFHQNRQRQDGSSTQAAAQKKEKKERKAAKVDKVADKPSPSPKIELAPPSDPTKADREEEDDVDGGIGGMFGDSEEEPSSILEVNTQAPEGDDGGGGLFGLLEEAENTIVSAEEINKSVAIDVAQTPSPGDTPFILPKTKKGKKTKGKNPLKAAAAAAAASSSSPSVWTGKSPRDHLQEFCTKRRLPRPVFKKKSASTGRSSRSHQYSVVIDWKTHKQEFSVDDKENEAAGCRVAEAWFGSIDEAKDTVATITLYRLTPDLPLYRVLPSAYRDLWLKWVEAKEKDAAAEAGAEKDEFEAAVDEIFSVIPPEIAAKEYIPPEEPKSKSSCNIEKDVGEVSGTLGDWDVDDWDADLADEEATANSSTSTPTPADQSVQGPMIELGNSAKSSERSYELKLQFEKRMNSSAYQKLAKRRAELPIAAFKSELLEAVSSHDVILISGETGCGKSTQVPQFLLEDIILRQQRGESCQIVCTQPRRLAATSVASRVSQELGERELGSGDSLTGYQIRLENRMTPYTKLLFCTTGVLLRKLQDPNTLANEISHIIVDEVHERDLQNDVLLSMLRQFLVSKPATSKLKVILMSATLNAESFQSYFGGAAVCPMMSVPGRTFPVKEYYLEDVLEATQFIVDEMSPAYFRGTNSAEESTNVTISGRGGTSYVQKITWESQSLVGSNSARERQRRQDEMLETYSEQTRRSLDCLDPSVINYELISELVEHLIATNPDLLDIQGKGEKSSRQSRSNAKSASILVFLTGLQEITTLLDMLSCTRTFRDGGSRYHLIPLHSSLSPQEQQRVFDMPNGSIRVIAATNIAETSLTIEDVKITIDAGRVKQMRHDSARRTNVLDEIWISRANAKQRMGRAGRTSDGLCYRLFPRSVFTFDMDEQPVAEIRRAPLASLCLQIKSFGITSMSCREFLAGCLDPPPDHSVRDALEELFEIGALRREDEALTTLGGHLAKLPVDVKVGKMLLIGAILREFDAVSTCAAILESRSPFVAPFGRQADMKQARKQFAVGNSDMLTDINAFQTWYTQFYSQSNRNRSSSTEKQFYHQTFLNRRALVEIAKLKRQFHGLVAQLGFTESGGRKEGDVEVMTRDRLVRVSSILFAGLAPNIVCIEQATASKKLILREPDRGNVLIHPGSVNHKVTAFPSPFLTFAVKLHTSQVYLPQSSLVMPLSLCLFSHNFELLPPTQSASAAAGVAHVRINDSIVIQSSLRTIALLQELRLVVSDWVEASLENPPFVKSGKKHSSGESAAGEDSKSIMGALSALLIAEYDQRDPKQLLTNQLYATVKTRS